MYTIMFVDDDLHVLKGYERKIDWESLNVKIIGTASDGKEALALIEERSPDIVLTDIKMPIMDGIELIKAIDERALHCHVIIQSGYDEFDFAKQAIKYNAVAYLLKPTSRDEIIEVVSEVIVTIKKEREVKEKMISNQLEIARSNLIEALMKQSSNEKISALMLACLESISYSDRVAAVILNNPMSPISDCPLIDHHEYQSFSGILSRRWDENHWLILFFMDGSVAKKTMLKKVLWTMVDIRNRLLNDSVIITIGAVTSDLNQLSESLSSAIKLVELKALMKDREIIICDSMDSGHKRSQPELNDLEHAIEKQNEQAIDVAFRAFFSWIKELKSMDKTSYEQIMTSIFKMLLLILKYPGNRESLPSEFEIWEGLTMQVNVEALEAYVFELVQDILLEKSHFESQNLSKPIQYVVQHVDKHYMDVIRLKDLAGDLFISENYLTTLFKKEMSLTFKKYLTKVRMENAKALLADPKLKVHQVAEQVGYENDDYFSKIFREVSGLSPSLYRTTITYHIQ